ncbi:MAG: DHH family phosphoesterase [Lachnospiraceae bacterium]|nr:DHH family phosphoesterase [Lachnospiraceae bacterium]
MEKLKVTGKLRIFLQWPFAVTALWGIMVLLFFLNGQSVAAYIGLTFLVVYFLIALYFYTRNAPQLMNELITFATQYGTVQKELLEEFSVPYALLDSDGRVLWMNREFMAMIGRDRSFHKNILGVFRSIRREDLPGEESETECAISWDGRKYRGAMQKVSIASMSGSDNLVLGVEEEYIIAMYLFDETELNELIDERDHNKLVCGFISLDNYDEALESVEEVRRSLLLALIERKINKYFNDVDGIVKSMEKDKYFFIIRKKSLETLESTRFSLLEDVKSVNIGNEMAMTISMGIGLGSNSYQENSDSARIALDLALGRGGDQVVVKDGYRTRFFGGKSESTEHFTRVKARVKAHALKEILMSRERVVIMGHKLTDADALGAAIGIYVACKTIDKPAHIVVDDVPESVAPLIDAFRDRDDFDENMFVDRTRAKELTNRNTAVVVVDTNLATRTECEELLHKSNTIIVLDHHRQSKGVINNAVLSYIEPYASSACEMVAEVLQYFDERMRLKNLEADSLYAGIMIDTNNFMTRTGVRTFEAAAYLRRNGADVVRVRKMFRDNIEDCRAKAQAIADAEFFEDAFAVSVCASEGLKSPTVVAAQAANELLNVVRVKASFVLTDYNRTIFISARAIDEVNVQLIMERLGGGGHLNIAGAQLKDHTLEEAKDLLKRTIREMKEEGDI